MNLPGRVTALSANVAYCQAKVSPGDGMPRGCGVVYGRSCRTIYPLLELQGIIEPNVNMLR